MIDNQDITERIKRFIEYKKKSIRQFEISCGLKEGLIKGSVSQKSAIGSDKIAIIITAYPELNANWLLTGKGEMLEGEKEKELESEEKPIELRDCEKEIAHLRELLAEKERLINVLMSK